MDKRLNIDEIENKKNLMITSCLNDKMRRNLLVNLENFYKIEFIKNIQKFLK